MKLRLLLFEDCNRKCPGCCNKQWNLSSLPVENDFSKYDKIILTGGEPMLKPEVILQTVEEIRKVNNCPIIVYTAKVDKVIDVLKILDHVDGLTLTLHEIEDLVDFYILNGYIYYKNKYSKKSLRLNVFKGIEVDETVFTSWKIKKDIEWIEDCPLPENEVFKKLEKK
jgi:pyruvate-formate lyase-activating enzyme